MWRHVLLAKYQNDVAVQLGQAVGRRCATEVSLNFCWAQQDAGCCMLTSHQHNVALEAGGKLCGVVMMPQIGHDYASRFE